MQTGTRRVFVFSLQGRNVYGPNVLCLNKSIIRRGEEIKWTRRPKYTFRLTSSLAIEVQPSSLKFFPVMLKTKGYISVPFTNILSPFLSSFLPSALVSYSRRVKLGQRYSTEVQKKGNFFFFFNNQPTITSFRSLVCKWCRGSRKFCLMLSSNEYFTSAICFIASPISMRAWAVNRN